MFLVTMQKLSALMKTIDLSKTKQKSVRLPHKIRKERI